MIHEEIVTYEVAKLAKEAGFPQDVDKWLGDLHSATNSNYYNHKGELNGDCIEIIKCKIQKEEAPKEFELVAAPTQSLLQRWLREKKDVHISIIANREEDDDVIWYSNEVLKDTGWSVCSWWERPMTVCYSSYEQALEHALKFALENLV